MTQETEQQRDERRARAYQDSKPANVTILFDDLDERGRKYLLGRMRAIAASDKEANWPFDPNTHVVTTKEVLDSAEELATRMLILIKTGQLDLSNDPGLVRLGNEHDKLLSALDASEEGEQE